MPGDVTRRGSGGAATRFDLRWDRPSGRRISDPADAESVSRPATLERFSGHRSLRTNAAAASPQIIATHSADHAR